MYHARFRGEHAAEAQAEALRRALARGDLPVIAWYRINDLPATEEVIGDDNNRHLGARDANGAPKPALRACEEIAALFAQPYRSLTAVIRARGTSADAVCAQAFALRDSRTVVFAWLAHPVPCPQPAASQELGPHVFALLRELRLTSLTRRSVRQFFGRGAALPHDRLQLLLRLRRATGATGVAR